MFQWVFLRFGPFTKKNLKQKAGPQKNLKQKAGPLKISNKKLDPKKISNKKLDPKKSQTKSWTPKNLKQKAGPQKISNKKLDPKKNLIKFYNGYNSSLLDYLAFRHAPLQVASYRQVAILPLIFWAVNSLKLLHIKFIKDEAELQNQKPKQTNSPPNTWIPIAILVGGFNPSEKY